MNSAYLATLRSSSCYPTFRAFVSVAAVIRYVASAIVAVAGIFAGALAPMVDGMVVAIILAALTKVGQEMSHMLADIADATLDTASQRSSASSAATSSSPYTGSSRIDLHDNESFTEAIRNNDVDAMTRMLSNRTVLASGVNRNGRGWLLFATVNGSIEAAKVLLQQGASATARDELGRSALEEAQKAGNEQLVSLFTTTDSR